MMITNPLDKRRYFVAIRFKNGHRAGIDAMVTVPEYRRSTLILRNGVKLPENIEINLYDRGKADIEPEKWWHALKDCCVEIKEHLSKVEVASFSVTTPGLVPMGEDGTALGLPF